MNSDEAVAVCRGTVERAKGIDSGCIGDFSNFFGLNCRLVKKFDFIQGKNFLVELTKRSVEEEIRR